MARPKSVERAWNVNPNAAFWQISFDSNGTKSKRPVRALLPRQVIRLLELYIQLRPALLGPGTTDPQTLFLNDHGKPLTAGNLAHHVAGITSRYLGQPVNPHLFRDILAEEWLASGRGLEGLSNILWHVDSSFTRRVYGRMFDESHGTKAVEDWLENTDLENDDDE
jgi:site-specific recombinase XerD